MARIHCTVAAVLLALAGCAAEAPPPPPAAVPQTPEQQKAALRIHNKISADPFWRGCRVTFDHFSQSRQDAGRGWSVRVVYRILDQTGQTQLTQHVHVAVEDNGLVHVP